MSIRLEHGDCREVVKLLADCSIDSCVTDPPYSLVSIQKRFGKPGSAPAQEGRDGLYRRASAGFMGQQWDTGETAFDPDWWREVYRVLKPGAHLVAFSGTRTYHRMACAIEDAGFEIRDQLAWCYGSGFPKSHNQRGDWEGWGTALKPAWEPICLARKALAGTVAANLLQHGTGALNIDACRVPTDDSLGGGAEKTTTADQKGNEGWTRPWMSDEAARTAHAERVRSNVERAEAIGRWPANVIHDGSPEVLDAFARFGERTSGSYSGQRNTDKTSHTYGEFRGTKLESPHAGSSGSAARFFFSAKADADDRWGSKHPTVKPVDLMRWLARLVTPPGGLVLEPFAGSGTTGVACLAEGLRAILVEREAEYISDIKARLDHYAGKGGHSLSVKQRNADPKKATGADTPLFARAAE